MLPPSGHRLEYKLEKDVHQVYRGIQRMLSAYKDEKRGPTYIAVQSPHGMYLLIFDLSRLVRKLYFCLCENKGADQLCSNCRLPSAPIFPIFSYIFRASYFFLYFDPKSYIFPSNSYIFQNTADNNEISRKNHGILV